MEEQRPGSSLRSSQRSIEINNLPLLERIDTELRGLPSVYLVGGAVRDLLLARPTHDLDFVTAGDALGVARMTANALGGAYYTMDQERETGRVILTGENGERTILDFSRQRGERLEDDLRLRDFTINALALDIHDPHHLIDPLGGSLDLRQKHLRACSPGSFFSDPIRVLRAFRQAQAFGLRIESESLQWLRQAVTLLPQVSVERQRDEIFRMLGGKSPASVLRALDMVGALEQIMPELADLKGVEQPPPHIHDVWDHTLDVLGKLEFVLAALDPAYDPDKANNLASSLVVLRLGKFRAKLNEHLSQAFTPDRLGRQLLFLSALYHDVAKPQTQTVDKGGHIRFFGHDLRGSEIVAQRSRALHLSNEETEHLRLIVRHHMRPLLLTRSETLTRKAVYRFFRDAHQAGVDICVLSVADHLATFGSALPQAEFNAHLDTVRLLMEAWWERSQETVTPPALIDGRDLMRQFHLEPGKKIGELLEAVREAQAAGQVQTRQQALEFIREQLGKTG